MGDSGSEQWLMFSSSRNIAGELGEVIGLSGQWASTQGEDQGHISADGRMDARPAVISEYFLDSSAVLRRVNHPDRPLRDTLLRTVE